MKNLHSWVLRSCLAMLAGACVSGTSAAQTSPATGGTEGSVPANASSVMHTTKAVNYRRAGGSIKVGFQGTELLQGATGEAKVESKTNRIEISAKFSGFEEATKFGLEYLTYVLWGVSPQGRAVNLGELVLKHGEGEVKAITDMQTFGMIVTAEPYFAVTQPGNVVVAENAVGPDIAARTENIDAQFELLGRGIYSSANTKIEGAIFGIDRKTPLMLFEARNAVRIAGVAQADKYAPQALDRATGQLKTAEEDYRLKRDKRTVEAAARDVVQTAEEARVMAVKRKAEEDAQAAAAAEQRAAEERAAKAKEEAAAEAKRREEADKARLQAEAAKEEAERMKKEAEQAAQEAERAKAAALQQQQAAIEQQKAAEAEAQMAQEAAQRAEAEKTQLRAQLLQQLNSILQTTDTARGLIVKMSDVLFDTGSASLKPGAREKLAKISGVLLAHPGLTLQIEGHTDSVGTHEFNQLLSERRADSVRDYLAEQGVPASSITAAGLGETQPVASNDTPEGRQQNRRVELVVNGAAIASASASQTTQQ